MAMAMRATTQPDLISVRPIMIPTTFDRDLTPFSGSSEALLKSVIYLSKRGGASSIHGTKSSLHDGCDQCPPRISNASRDRLHIVLVVKTAQLL